MYIVEPKQKNLFTKKIWVHSHGEFPDKTHPLNFVLFVTIMPLIFS